MRRDGVDYMRCLSCDQVFEADDLELAPQVDLEDDAEDPRLIPHRHRKAS